MTQPNEQVNKFESEAERYQWLYGDSPVANKGLCTAILLTECQTPRKAKFQVTEMRGYLIVGRETVQQIGYIDF